MYSAGLAAEFGQSQSGPAGFGEVVLVDEVPRRCKRGHMGWQLRRELDLACLRFVKCLIYWHYGRRCVLVLVLRLLLASHVVGLIEL